MNGKYIVVEGIVGSGKTTQSKRLQKTLKDNYPDKKILWTREPGGSEIADEIRRVVQGMEFEEKMDPVCEAYLYASSRAQTLRNIVKPVLKDGGIVVSDRNFVTSLTNQAAGRGLGIDRVLKINRQAVGNITPDLVIHLNIPIDVALSRIDDEDGDKFEKLGKEFYKEVVEGYEKASKIDILRDAWVNVDATGDINEVESRVWNEVRSFF